MIEILYHLIKAIQPILVPLCFVSAWTFVILLGWSLWSGMRATVARAKQMHQIPCANCQFFTNDYRLKCTIQPYIANTEKAIDCCDYRPGR
ncbi:MAG: hypothetical protein DSM107014_02790 [Gomphosphaeria aponina SAG 52.96 = DSM 107014]|uniref:Uncharacterized protein n=1 Tax=Gomphosphaeria aponina SAG 52.96 = DSM 107014 TaxID=1521640 RepID=A0A941GWT7_9CHRO|nr:hypothetical protein [Gomphosphaeria aponina SAG 52.96 = DSM 107014]